VSLVIHFSVRNLYNSALHGRLFFLIVVNFRRERKPLYLSSILRFPLSSRTLYRTSGTPVTKTSINPIIVALTGSLYALLLNGCAGHRLLTSEPPTAHATPGGEENRTVLFERVFHFTPSGALTARTHTIVRVGSSGTEEVLDVVDGSVERLTAFEARVMHAGGSLEWYGRGDLGNYSLSNSRVIADVSLRFVLLKRAPRPGDLIEMAYEHDLALPGLGVLFTVGESGTSSDSVHCVFEVPVADTLLYRVLNDSLTLRVTRNGDVTEYAFTWAFSAKPRDRGVFSKSNDEPGVIAIDPARGPATWRAFGDWYIDLIGDRLRPDDRITAEAKRVTQSSASDVEKMNAIADYCQSTLRYEQVYLARGEFIPNGAPAVLAKRFGDCKDYTCLIVSMARALGLDAHPALCHRGRQFEVCEELPVSQFNHMVAHFRSAGKDYWYDGTNQSGIPGMTADDLVNTRALIVEKGNSRMSLIPESEVNLFSVQGTLHARDASLAGDLKIRLAGQYAVGLQFLSKAVNEGNMRSALVAWLKEGLADRLTVTRLRWKSTGGVFDIEATCDIPNSLVKIDRTTYVRFDKVFDNLLPSEEPGGIHGTPYEYPRYARVAIGLDVPELAAEDRTGSFHWDLKYTLPPGPFSPEERIAFPRQLHAVQARFAQTFKFPGKD
jgi:hypothetical protein